MATTTKPRVNLTGTDGNVFALTAVCSRALKAAGLYPEAKEMTAKVFKAHSYDEALGVMSEYVDIR
jgi:hypothetical protein